MAFSIKEIRVGESASRSRQGVDHRRAFIIDLDNKTSATMERAIGFRGVPFVGEAHPNHAGSFVVAVDAKYLGKSFTVFRVEVDYSSHQAVAVSDDPISRPIEVTISGIKAQEAMAKDLDGKSVVNSAGVPFDSPPMRDVSRQVMTIVRNEANFDLGTARAYADTLNSGIWFGQAPGTVKMAMPTGVLDSIGNQRFVRVTYEMHFSSQPDDDPDAEAGAMKPWDHLDVLDMGLDELAPEPVPPPDSVAEFYRKNKVIPRELADTDGNIDNVPITDPVPLDGNGYALARVIIVEGVPIPNELVYLRFRPYRRVDWASLDLLVG